MRESLPNMLKIQENLFDIAKNPTMEFWFGWNVFIKIKYVPFWL